MKFIKKHVDGEHDRYYFALGKNEAEIMLGLVENADRHTPYCTDTEIFKHRVMQLKKTISKALTEMT